MKFKVLSILFSLVLMLSPALSQANMFNGDISFSNCTKSCNSAGEHEIKFHDKVDFTLRIIVDEDSYFPVMKTVSHINKKVNWSFHIVFFDNSSTIVAAYSLSGEATSSNKYGQHTNSARINMLPEDMSKITKYTIVVYTF